MPSKIFYALHGADILKTYRITTHCISHKSSFQTLILRISYLKGILRTLYGENSDIFVKFVSACEHFINSLLNKNILRSTAHIHFRLLSHAF